MRHVELGKKKIIIDNINAFYCIHVHVFPVTIFLFIDVGLVWHTSFVFYGYS